MNSKVVLDGEVRGDTYFVFDLLYANGKDLRKEKLRVRKKLLQELSLNLNNVKILSKEKGTRVAKNLESTYHSGTSSDWLIVDEKKTPSQNEALLTNLGKLYFPEEGITKGDVINYYREMSDLILPYLLDRPESLNRHPNGITAPSFYQKDMTGHLPKFIKTKRIFSESADKTIDYLLCQDLQSLLYIANLGCIEINPWFSRIQNLDRPDFLVIDLDPDGNNFDHVIEIAQSIHKILGHVGADNFCKTSGSTGIHIGVPLGAKYTFDEARAFAELVCQIINKKHPSTTSIERNPNRRKKKIYLDFMQNRRGQTLAAPFCIRPKSGAPVSMPLTWKELSKGLRPEQFNIQNAKRLIARKKDPWKGVLGAGIDLKKCLSNLKKKFIL